MAAGLVAERSILATSQILQMAIVNVQRCRLSAVGSAEWSRLPHDDFLRILNVAVEKCDCEFEVYCHSEDFIRAHGRAGILFMAGKFKAASAHELAAKIRVDFLERAFQENWRDHCIDSDSPESLLQSLDRQLEEDEAAVIWSEFCELPEFDSEELAIQMQQELAFVSKPQAIPDGKFTPWIDSPKMIELMKKNGVRGASDRTIGRRKVEWGAEYQTGSNHQIFRFKISKLQDLGIKYPVDWD